MSSYTGRYLGLGTAATGPKQPHLGPSIQMCESKVQSHSTVLHKGSRKGQYGESATDHLAEIPAGLLIQTVGLELRGVLVFFLQSFDLLLLLPHFRVDLNVELEEVVDRIFCQLLLATISLESKSEEAILLSPVSEV